MAAKTLLLRLGSENLNFNTHLQMFLDTQELRFFFFFFIELEYWTKLTVVIELRVFYKNRILDKTDC